MNVITFDTLKFARTLEEKGAFTHDQASRMVEALGGVLATEITTRSDLRELELHLKAQMAEFRADLVKWLVGPIGFQTVVILSAVAALTHFAH